MTGTRLHTFLHLGLGLPLLLLGCAMFFQPAQVQAAAGDGATSDIQLLEATINGEVDRITFSVANPNGETWSLVGTAPYGISVTQSGAPITISSVTITSAATANPVLIRVELDQTDTDLQLETNGVSTNAVELVYTQQTGNQTCTQCIRDAIDEELNTIATGDGSGAVNSELDRMAPIISYFDYADNYSAGRVDSYTVYFSEQVIGASSDLVFSNFLVANDGDFDGLAFRTDPGDLLNSDMTGFFTNFDSSHYATVVDTHDDSGLFQVTTQGTFTLTDAAGNANTQANFAGGLPGVTYRDDARPVVVSVSPTQSSTTASPTASLVITFSEAMDTGFVEATEFTVSPDAGSFTPTWSAGNSVVTLAHSGNFIRGSTITVATDNAQINAASGQSTTLLTTGPEDGDWTFRVASSSSNGSSSTATAKTYSIDLILPTTDTDYATGSEIPVSWSTNGSTGTISAVNLSYSTDGGTTRVPIVTGTANDGLHTWTPSATLTGAVAVYIEGTDLVTILATDTVSITLTADTSDTITTTAPNTTTTAPYTFIRGESWSAVYLVTADGQRLPFLNEQVFATYADNFDDVVTVTDAELAEYSLGSPASPRAGTMLVKVQSVNKVFAVDGTPESSTLRWITSEELATELYGDNWADYVMDIEPTMWSHFILGDDIESSDDITVDASILRPRGLSLE